MTINDHDALEITQATGILCPLLFGLVFIYLIKLWYWGIHLGSMLT